jgi:OmpA-OmpF porin, OOP family
MKMKWMLLTVLLAGIAQAQEMELQVELMNRVGTETSRKGDLVSARSISPAGFQGSMVEGKIQDSISGAKSRSESVLDIEFDMLRQNNVITPVNSRIKSVANSKGAVNVDEDGRMISRSGENKPAKTAGLGRALASLASSKPAVAAATAATAPAASAAAAPAPTPQSGSGQPNLSLVKDEFVPGDNTIFYDDFTDMSVGDAPPHFKVRGATPELMAGGGIRQLTMNAKVSLFPNLTALPKNFTFETEVKFDIPKGRASANLILSSKGKQILHWIFYAQEKNFDLIVSLRAPYQELGRKRITVNFDQPVKLALWVQNGRMRSYVNGEKQLDFNQVDMLPIDSVEIETSFLGAGPSLGYRVVRFAESTPDFSQILMSSGRYIARGILFDTDSDRIKPESAPVIKLIAQALEKNPNLKLLIEGHTDSIGDAAHNLDLSKRRAEAVKSVLVSQFNMEAVRLSTNGLGSTKPVDSNDTPQGRMQNRRVELVKQ